MIDHHDDHDDHDDHGDHGDHVDHGDHGYTINRCFLNIRPNQLGMCKSTVGTDSHNDVHY